MKKNSLALWLLAPALFFSCKKDMHPSNNNPAAESAIKRNAVAEDLRFFLLGEGNRIDEFELGIAERLLSSITVTGLQPGERLLSIDFRPATGQLYALGSSSRLYVINLQSGIARMVGPGSFSPALTGSIASLDFNPTVDRIRVVTNTGQNLRLHPETGAVVAVDGSINGAPGATITAVAYTNSFAGATATTLYDIDVTNDMLYKQDPPNDGKLVTVGRLNANLSGEGGFDIAPGADGAAGSMGLAVYRQNKKSTLYTIDLNTGRARKMEKFDKDDLYYGLAIPTNPVAYAVSMNSLLIFNPMVPANTLTKGITGLQTGESILGIDFRPSTGALYALGSSSRLYTINPSTGAAGFVASLSEPLNGSSFGFDFNPVPDLLRIVSNTGQNLRVNPATGVATVDGAINPSPAFITAAAYTNNFAGTTATMLYVIDSDNNTLYMQAPPNDGTLANGKRIGISIDTSNGFDIGGTSNKAYGIFTSGGQTKLYSVDMSSGAATPMGPFSSAASGFALGLGF